jgi:hypothetical protein
VHNTSTLSKTPFITSAVQLDEFLGDMLRVDTAAPLSPAVSEHAVAVAGRPAATAHDAAVLLRSAAAVRRRVFDCWSGSDLQLAGAAPQR